jgi:hypothetical protein
MRCRTLCNIARSWRNIKLAALSGTIPENENAVGYRKR